MSLRARLILVLVALFLVVGASIAIGVQRGSRLYFEEVHYRLNRDVAAHVAKSLHPFAAGPESPPGELDRDVLQALFMDVMHLNPSLEVYLLDPAGRILAFDAPAGRVVRESVSLEPIRRALADASDEPDGPERRGPERRGDDPRDASRTLPFSVAVLGDAAQPEGYLYVILGGEIHQEIAAGLRESALLRNAGLLLGGSIGLAALVGALSIGLLVRPLRRLRDAMTTLPAGERPADLALEARGEVGDLARTFQAMASRIVSQIDELRRNDRRRREFVANVSHDLRTPTGIVQGYLETLTLRGERLAPEQREEFLRSALRQAQRLGALVDQLFELARLDAEEFTPQRETFSLAELVQDVVAKFQVEAGQKDIQLHASIGYEVPPIEADIGLLERALDNLIDNALRYTQPGGSVSVALRQVQGGVGVSVSDTGPGIPDADLPHLFDRFYRVERDGHDEKRGTGLGLAITKRIVDLHRGSIRVESRPDQGTVFSLVLEPALAGA